MILDFDLCERAMIHGRETNCGEAFIRTTIVALIFLSSTLFIVLLFCVVLHGVLVAVVAVPVGRVSRKTASEERNFILCLRVLS